MSINRVTLEGNVGKDPVVRYFDKGVAKATFPLATTESYINQNRETVTTTEWHNIVLWRGLASIAEKDIKKGSRVFITGSIRTRSYVDKDNITKYITEIIGDSVIVYDKPQTGSQSQTSQAQASGQAPQSSYSQGHSQYPVNNGNPTSDNSLSSQSQMDNFQKLEEDDLPF